MPWPDIFFKARKSTQESEPRPPFKPAPEGSKPAPSEPKPPAIKPVPAALGPQTTPPTAPAKTGTPLTNTRTLPAMHGVVLRAPAQPATPPVTPPVVAAPTSSDRPSEPIKNIEQLMAEADPVRTLSQTGSVRLLKRVAPQSDATKGPAETPAEPVPVKSETAPVSVVSPSPWPSFNPAVAPIPIEAKKADPAPSPQAPPASPVSTGVPTPEENDSPFILNPTASPTDTPKAVPPAHAPLMPFGSIFHRKAKMTELARIVLPPKREETQQLHPLAESSPTVVPAAFPVAAMTVRANKTTGENPEPSKASVRPVSESPFLERTPAEGNKTEAARVDPEPPKATDLTASIATESPSVPIPLVEEKPPVPASPSADFAVEPKVDPEAHKSEPSAESLPKVDPEAHRSPPVPAPPVPSTKLSDPALSSAQEKREFHLTNGERVAGIVLSETPEAVYINHGTLGVLTIPRAQIAKRLVEIILINGDRIVGDIMAETADMLYVRHASLGMLSVPRAQRSTRVVEAILKDGDRILGEVLTETDTFTVIRSATLGTITVPHDKVAMLNRKIEQIELKSLPPPLPEIKDKPSE